MPGTMEKIENPLTMIAIFAGISESITLAVLPLLANTPAGVPPPLVWFAIGFPSTLVVLFFLTLNFNRVVLYAPSDFSDEKEQVTLNIGTL